MSVMPIIVTDSTCVVGMQCFALVFVAGSFLRELGPHTTQGCNTLGIMVFSIFFPFLWVFLVAITGFATGFSLNGMAVVVSLTGGASSGVRGVNPVEVMFVLPDMACDTKYQTGIVKDMFGNIIVVKTFCDTKPGGGYRKGVWETT